MAGGSASCAVCDKEGRGAGCLQEGCDVGFGEGVGVVFREELDDAVAVGEVGGEGVGAVLRAVRVWEDEYEGEVCAGVPLVAGCAAVCGEGYGGCVWVHGGFRAGAGVLRARQYEYISEGCEGAATLVPFALSRRGGGLRGR